MRAIAQYCVIALSLTFPLLLQAQQIPETDLTAEASILMPSTTELISGDKDLIPLNVYPNPISDQIKISSVDPVDWVIIIDEKGKRILRMRGDELRGKQIDSSRLEAGFYTVHLWAGKHKRSFRMIKL